MKGIDCSENNGKVDWDAVKEAGVDFAIVRCSYGLSSEDEMFLENVNEAHKRGIKCGAYHYSYSLDEEGARQEAENCKRVIEEAGVLLELPVFFDMEDADHYKANHDFAFGAEEITNMCKAFIDTLGLNCGVYASESWFDDYIDWRLLGCAVWNAAWNSPTAHFFEDANSNNDGIQGYMWQFTDALYIDGAYFDGNIIYDDVDKAGQDGY